MKQTLFICCAIFLFAQCKNAIKNENTQTTQEKGTEIPASSNTTTVSAPTTVQTPVKKDNIFWVGDFLQDASDKDSKYLSIEGAVEWNRANKINISIDKIEGDKVTGHSVVAGHDRPFVGSVKTEKGMQVFEVKEPGDDQYDGKFNFSIKDSVLSGTWAAFKPLEISKRKYELKKKAFVYNPNIKLAENSQFMDWNKTKPKKANVAKDEYIANEFASATNKIYEVNASNKLLTAAEVANLKKGDILVVRNAIYARHGYSFKNRPLRIFFDAQDWYVPVYADIKTNLTDIEKKNIELLLRYEQHAKEYYDYFGR
jgi:hypothetical protein